jgi:hypothetical protein
MMKCERHDCKGKNDNTVDLPLGAVTATLSVRIIDSYNTQITFILQTLRCKFVHFISVFSAVVT